MQATSQALQPMQVVVSMSLQTVNSRWVSSPDTLPAWPEIFWMRSAAWLMDTSAYSETTREFSASSGLFHLHEEALEFRSIGIGVDHRRREQIRQRPRVLAFVLGDSPIALMNGEANRIDFLAVDHQRLDSLGDHRFRNVISTDARYFYFFAAGEAHFIGHLHRNLDKRLWYELHVHRIILRPVVIKLGQAIGRADNRVTVLGRRIFVVRRFETLHHGIVRLLRMQHVVHRAFYRLVEFGERSIGKSGERRKNSPYALRIHDEWAHVIFRLGVDFEVG